MEQALQVFENAELSTQIRMLMIDDEPWFVGKDIATFFGDSHYRRSISRLDEDEKTVLPIETNGGKQRMTFINEFGMFSLLFYMQPEKAKGVTQNDTLINERIAKLKNFKRWVTHEVLPSIRKTGSYSVSKEKQYSFKDIQEALTEGYNMGYEVGCKENMHGTYNQAYRTGYELGHTAGLKDSEHIYDRATTYNQGFQDGYKAGYGTGYDSAYKETFKKGSNKGYAIAIDNTKD